MTNLDFVHGEACLAVVLLILIIIINYINTRGARSKMFHRALQGFSIVLILAVFLTACGGNGSEPANANNAGNSNTNQETASPAPTEAAQPTENGTRTITYLGESYELPEHVEKIVITGAVEAMEDSIVLDVNPVGAISFSGKFPPLFESITKNAVSIGEKTEPNFEAILSLKPDVILGSTKFPEEVTEQLSAIAPTILYSHISTNWEDNLRLLGELSGKADEGEAAIAKYKEDLQTAQAELGDKMQDKEVVVIRLRGGKLYVYPQDVYFNPVLYEDLGFKAPEEIVAAQAQEELSVEKFAEMNPDYVFLQFSEDENKETPNALQELQSNPIINSVAAVKEGRTFLNVVDPLAQGGTAYSKIAFLEAVVSQLSK